MKKVVARKSPEKILGSLNSGKKESIFGRRCCKNARTQNGGKKEVWKDFKKMNAKYFCLREIVLGHPCVPRVRMDTGSDKRRV